MEKELSLRSENFAKLADKKLVNWKDVQKALKPGEAAVEIVRVKKFGIEKTVTDTSDPKKPVYQVKGLTDTIYYAALVVKPGSIIPEMVILKNGNDMEAVIAILEKAKSETGNGKPVVIILNTEMGFGIDYMMGSHAWHGKAPNDEQLALGIKQLYLEAPADY
jgi:hypothetical protein